MVDHVANTGLILGVDGKPIQSAESYRGAHLTKKNANWIPDHTSGDSAIGDSFDMLLRRIREMSRDDPVVKACRRAVVKGVIGTGILSFAGARTGNDFDDYDEEFNDPSDELFDQWSEDLHCDIEGRFSFEEMQAHQWASMMEGGESIWLEVENDTPGRDLPLSYQMLEAEQIDESKDWDAGEDTKYECRRGIEYDIFGRPQHYWLFDIHPYGDRLQNSLSVESKRVPASRVIHTYLPNRPSEHRGITWFTNLQHAKDLDWFLGNELTSKAINSLFGVYFKRERGQGSGTGLGGTDGAGNATTKLGAGIIGDLGPNDSIETVQSNRGSADANPFIQLMLQLQSMSVGISKIRMTGDYSDTSYTSARGAHLDDQAFFMMLQKFATSNFVRPIRKRHQERCVKLGLIPRAKYSEYIRKRRRFEAISIQPPGREQIDPEKETAAARDRVKSGFSTWTEECGKRGRSFRKLVREVAREHRLWMKHLGFIPDIGQSKSWYETFGEEIFAKALTEEAQSARTLRRDQQAATQTAGSPA